MMYKEKLIQVARGLIKFIAHLMKYYLLIILTIFFFRTLFLILSYSYLYSIKDEPEYEIMQLMLLGEYEKYSSPPTMPNPFTQAIFDEYQRRKLHHESWQGRWDNTIAWQYFTKGEDKQSVMNKLPGVSYTYFIPEHHQLLFNIEVGGGIKYNTEYLESKFLFSPEDKLEDIIIRGFILLK